jgi:hypothetical protein
MRKFKLIKKYPSLPTDWENNMEVGTGDRVLDYSPCSSKYFDFKISNREVENYPEFWEEIKEFPKILAFRSQQLNTIYERKGEYFFEKDKNTGSLTEYFLLQPFYEIYQVQTESGEILTIGDKVTWHHKDLRNLPYCTINKFVFINEVLKIVYKELPSSTHGFYSDLHKYKELLFTTEDGVEIFEGDTFFFILEDWKVIENTNGKLYGHTETKPRFSTKKAAEKWIDENKPMFSKKQINYALNQLSNDFAENRIKRFKEKLGL